MLALLLIELCPYQISRNRRRHIRNEVSLSDIPAYAILNCVFTQRYYARVDKVYPPKYSFDEKARDAHKDASSSSYLSVNDPPHVIGGDLRIPTKEATAKDDPSMYFYWVHVTELEKDKSHEKGKSSVKNNDKETNLVGSLIEVQCGIMR
jgi:hypothetical protein